MQRTHSTSRIYIATVTVSKASVDTRNTLDDCQLADAVDPASARMGWRQLSIAALACVLAAPSYADNVGNGSLQLCPTPSQTDGHAYSYAGGPHALTCSAGFSFSLHNAGDERGAGGFNAATARITGYENGTLELLGGSTVDDIVDDIVFQDTTRFDTDANLQQQQIKNVRNGVVDKDAINLGQRNAINTSIARALGAELDAEGNVAMPTYTTLGQTVNGVTPAFAVLDSKVSEHRTNIQTHDDTVGHHTTELTNIETGLGNISDTGGAGLVQQTGGDQAPIGVGSNKGGTLVDLSGSNGDRRLTGIANDLANDSVISIAQLKAVGLIDAQGNSLSAFTYDDASRSRATLHGADGSVLDNLADGQVSAGSLQAINGDQLWKANQQVERQYSQWNTKLQQLGGRLDAAHAQRPGPSLGGAGVGSTQAGGGHANGDQTVAIGNDATADGFNSTASGSNAQAQGDSSTALGHDAIAGGHGSTAIGNNAQAQGQNSDAIGNQAQAHHHNATALGDHSRTDRDNSVSVGSEGNERQVVNVADGTQPNDAVNLRQLQQMVQQSTDYTNQRINQTGRTLHAGIAGAIAMANIPQPYQAGQSGIGAGAGSFRGQSALAMGVSAASPTGRWIWRGSVMANTQGDAGAGFSASRYW